MRILSCNIRYHGAADGDDHWTHRRDFCIEVMRSRDPQVICCQEVWREQHEDLVAGLPEFEAHGLPDEAAGHSPVNALFFRRDAFRCRARGGYWLSATPHVAGSRSWESACIRLANWVRLEELASGRELRVVNTHLDHVSQVAREQQAAMLVDDAAAYPNEYAQLLTGDLNCDVRNAAIVALAAGGWRDTYQAVHGTADPGFTYHAFHGPAHESALGKIDWIFSRGRLQVIDAAIIDDSRNGRFPSDHYFLSADVEL